MLQVRVTGAGRSHESARGIDFHPVATGLNTFNYQRVILSSGRRTQPATPFLAKVIGRLQTHIEGAASPVDDKSASRTCIFAGCELFLDVHRNRTTRNHCHAESVDSGVLDTDV